MHNIPIILLGKILSFSARVLNLGHGSTWPGHLALKINKNFIRDYLNHSKIKTVIVAGTNGKTTTTKLISTILKAQGKSVLYNISGANLLNGIASSLLLHSSILSSLNYDYAIFEVDENTLPLALKEIKPDYLIILNLFRDQLDRYGEVNLIAAKWQKAVATLSNKTTLILNADDPQVAYLQKNTKADVRYFDCSKVLRHENSIREHAVDSIYCPNCGTKLIYRSLTFSHLGDWYCPGCKLKKPKPDIINSPLYPLTGLYNIYNTNASVLLSLNEGISQDTILSALKNFTPAFGRQEEIIIANKKIRIFLSKNPTGLNESLRTAKELGGRNFLFVLNDRIPDGKDVSWIWDTDIENILEGNESLYVSGDRAYDMALRIKYSSTKFQISNFKFQIFENLEKALSAALDNITNFEALFIIPTYTAMLEVRKILTGKKIL